MTLTRRQMYSLIARDFGSLITLGAGAIAIGVLYNNFRERPLPLIYATKAVRLERAVVALSGSGPTGVPNAIERDVRAQTDLPIASPEEIDLTEFQERLTKPGVVLLDARPEIFYRYGHIPGALPLPRDEFEIYFPRIQSTLNGSKEREILVYCQGSDCEDSHLVAAALARLGYSRLGVFTGGWNVWTQRRLPEEK